MKRVIVFFSFLFLLNGCGASFEKTVDKERQSAHGIVGTWNATHVTDTLGGSSHTCEDSKIQISRENPNGAGGVEPYILIQKRSFSCAGKTYTSEWGQLALTWKDEKLYQLGVPVGTMTENYLQFDYQMSPTVNWKISIFQSGDYYRYQESMTGHSTTEADLL